MTLEALLDPSVERRIQSPPRAGPSGLKLTPDDLEAYLGDLFRKGRVSGTLETYRRNIYALYEDLPAVIPATLEAEAGELLEPGRWRLQ